MFGTEDRREREAGVCGMRILCEHVDGAAPLAVQPGLVGEQTHTQMAAMLLCESLQGEELLRLEDIDAGHHIAIARGPAACAGKRLVVAGELGELAVLLRPDTDSLRGSIRNTGAQHDGMAVAIRVNRVGEDDDIGVALRVHPERGAGEAGVAEGADRKERAAIAGEGRVDIPAKSAQRGAGRGLLGLDHLGESELVEREVASAAGEPVEQRLGEGGHVCSSAEEAGVTGDAFHAARGGVVHNTA